MMRPDSRAWLRLLSVAAWTTALVLGEDGSASSAGTLELLRAMQQQMNGMEQQMNGMESRIASLEADNRRLRAAPRAANADPAAESWAVGPLGNGRRLEQQSCCRWTNSGACPSADVTYKCTSLHEYLETKTTTHVFEDVSACPGSDPSALFHGESANVALSSGGSEVIRVPTPLKVIHPANCTGATMEIQLNTSVPSLLVGGVDISSMLANVVALAKLALELSPGTGLCDDGSGLCDLTETVEAKILSDYLASCDFGSTNKQVAGGTETSIGATATKEDCVAACYQRVVSGLASDLRGVTWISHACYCENGGSPPVQMYADSSYMACRFAEFGPHPSGLNPGDAGW